MRKPLPKTIYQIVLERLSNEAKESSKKATTTQPVTPVPAPTPTRSLKRGHNTDYSLTKKDRDTLISTTRSRKSRAILILLANDWAPADILNFEADEHLQNGRLFRPSELKEYSPDFEDDRPKLPRAHIKTLSYFPDGFNFKTTVTIWRHVHKSLLAAHERGDIYLQDLSKIPFPEALRSTKEEVLISSSNKKELLGIIVSALQDPDNVELWEETTGGKRHLFIDVVLGKGE